MAAYGSLDLLRQFCICIPTHHLLEARGNSERCPACNLLVQHPDPLLNGEIEEFKLRKPRDDDDSNYDYDSMEEIVQRPKPNIKQLAQRQRRQTRYLIKEKIPSDIITIPPSSLDDSTDSYRNLPTPTPKDDGTRSADRLNNKTLTWEQTPLARIQKDMKSTTKEREALLARLRTHSIPQSSIVQSSPNQTTDMQKEINIKIQPFSGKPTEDIEVLISHIDQFAVLYNKSDEYKAKQIPFFLRGGAHLFWRDLPASHKLDYKKITDGLRIMYGPLQATDDILYPRLANSNQKPSTTVQTFYEEFLRLKQNLDVSPSFLLGTFLNGLLPHLKNYVVLRQPKTVQDAVQLAKIAEIQVTPDEGVSKQIEILNAKLDRWNSLLGENISITKDQSTNCLAAAITANRFRQQTIPAEDDLVGDLVAAFQDSTMPPKINKMNTKEIAKSVASALSETSPNDVLDPIRCQICHQIGHGATWCSSYKARDQGRFHPYDQKQLFCHRCGRTGSHETKNCFVRLTGGNNTPLGPRKPPRNFSRQVTFQPEPPRIHFSASMAEIKDLKTTVTTSQTRNNSPTCSESHSQTYPPLKMTIFTKIYDKKAVLLVDTGANCQLIHERLLRKLSDVPVRPSSIKEIRTVDGSKATVLGEVTLPLNIMGYIIPTTMTVIKCYHYDGIIGSSFLQKHGALIDTNNQCLHLTVGTNNIIVPLGRNPTKIEKYSIHLAETAEVKPFTELIINGKVENCPVGKDVIFDALNECPKDILADAYLGAVMDREIPCRLINATKTLVHPSQYLFLATIIVLTSLTLLCLAQTPSLRTLYSCDTSTLSGTYRVAEPAGCANLNKSSSVSTSTADILIKSVFEGASDQIEKFITSLRTATIKIIDSARNSSAKIIKSFTSGILLWILVIILYIFLFSQYLRFTPNLVKFPNKIKNNHEQSLKPHKPINNPPEDKPRPPPPPLPTYSPPRHHHKQRATKRTVSAPPPTKNK